MNTDLLKKHCGIDIADMDKRALRCEEVKLTDAQEQRLKDNHPKGMNHLLNDKVTAYRVTYKRKYVGVIKVVWWLAGTIGIDRFLTEDEFRTILN